MKRKLQPKTEALTDQVRAILAEAEGFPLGTGEVARQLGQHLVSWGHPKKPLKPRPPCWPDDFEDPEIDDNAWCGRCARFHRAPVWRNYDAEDVRPVLNRLVRDGEVEKVTTDESRNLYWRDSR